jgi:DCN1-like protein 4/5
MEEKIANLKKKRTEEFYCNIPSKKFRSLLSETTESFLSKLTISDPCSDNYDWFVQKHFQDCNSLYRPNTENFVKIELLCSDLGVPLTLCFFALAFKFKAVTTRCFSRDEFIKGLIPLLVDSTSKLVQTLNDIEDFAKSNVEKIFLYSFNLLKNNEHQKLLSLPSALHYLDILLGHLPHTTKFINFMRSQNCYKGLNYDQWQMFLLFNKTVTLDYSNYDINDAWPVILDDFVQHETLQRDFSLGSDEGQTSSHESEHCDLDGNVSNDHINGDNLCFDIEHEENLTMEIDVCKL